MYSLILAAAIAGGPDTPSFGCCGGCGLFGLRARLFPCGLFGRKCRKADAVWVPPAGPSPGGYLPPEAVTYGAAPMPAGCAGCAGMPPGAMGFPAPGGPPGYAGPGYPPPGFPPGPPPGYAEYAQGPQWHAAPPAHQPPPGYGFGMPPAQGMSPGMPMPMQAAPGTTYPSGPAYPSAPAPSFQPQPAYPSEPNPMPPVPGVPGAPATIPPAGTSARNRPWAPITPAHAVMPAETEPAPARLVLEVPAGARVFVDGQPVPGTGPRRKFHTPDLPRGRTFYYQFRAEVVVNGKVEAEERVIAVCAGDQLLEPFRRLPAQ